MLHIFKKHFWLYSREGKTLGIEASSMFSTYDIDKTYITLFHRLPTWASHFSQNRLDTMGEIVQTRRAKLVMMNSFRILDGSFFAHLMPDILTKNDIKEIASKRNI